MRLCGCVFLPNYLLRYFKNATKKGNFIGIEIWKTESSIIHLQSEQKKDPDLNIQNTNQTCHIAA